MFLARAHARALFFNVSRETFVEFVIRFFAIAQNDSATLLVTLSLSKGLLVSRETFLKNYYFILKFIQNGDIILNVRKIL